MSARQQVGLAEAPRERRWADPWDVPGFTPGQSVVCSVRGSLSLAGCRVASARGAVPVFRPADGRPWVAPSSAAGAGPGSFRFGLCCRHPLTHELALRVRPRQL